ncbi:hypothetical protein J4H86_12095 [Spiractinospora alimapuensis]|uniref:DUF6912 family protein n=1 Tax=Spiractinospora alimapuensis TaxID=2820884 RepID=UPI001F2A49BE|nr:hypothetical protein [Spiractinospora alimapuensis]QVQ54349.1 hypothetical protein J4H86_12095 [Spiractinospora alimapuensis]
MRVYLPSTLPRIRELVASGTVAPAPLKGFAVTDALRSAVEGDEEELEYEAFTAAANASLELLAEDPDAPRRRVVLAVEITDTVVDTDPAGAPGASPAGVTVEAQIPRKRVAAAHVDDPAAEEAVAAALGPGDAAGLEDHDLLWFATQELRYIEE